MGYCAHTYSESLRTCADESATAEIATASIIRHRIREYNDWLERNMADALDRNIPPGCPVSRRLNMRRRVLRHRGVGARCRTQVPWGRQVIGREGVL
jgi:hypothetical protein